MTDFRSETASIAERTRPLIAPAAIVAVHFLGDRAAFVLGEEAVLLLDPDGTEHRIEVHAGAILSAAGAAGRLVTGGDDGKVVLLEAGGTPQVVATDAKRRWIDQVALGPDGAVAWSAGKTAFVRTGKGEERARDVASTVGGLAFAPKGFRLAVAHYNGVTLWFPNATQAEPEMLDWKGSHLMVRFSPDGRFVVTGMQEPMLHGWRLADKKHMRMSGYAARVRSLDWTADGEWLASGGADQLVLWPFQSKDGPMGKQPKLLAPAAFRARLEVVACHPRQGFAAVGYDDGMVVLVRLADGGEVIAKRPGDAPITALGWNAAGTLVAWGAEDGSGGVVDIG